MCCSPIPQITMSSSHDSLPAGLMDELLEQLPQSTRRHLLTTLSNQTTNSNELNCRQEVGNDLPRNEQTPIHELQAFIFSNITRVGKLFFSKVGHGLRHFVILSQLIIKNHLCNLVELDLSHDQMMPWFAHYTEDHDVDNPNDGNDDAKKALLVELHSVLPSLLNSLPRLQSLTLPHRIDHTQGGSCFFSLPGLFPTGQSCHLEKLCLQRTRFNHAHLKYLALHSNYMFPTLTHLDVSCVDLSGKSADDETSCMHYLMQWVERSMPKLAHLFLDYCYLTTEDIATDLANSPILSQLESLDLGRNEVEVKGWETLFTSAQFTKNNSQGQARLKVLKLDFTPLIEPLIPLLAQNCPYLTNLTTLSLDHCELTDGSIQTLCDSKWIRGLESLSLQGSLKMTSDAIRMIMNSAGMRNLTSLVLEDRRGQFPIDLLRHITQSQHASPISTIVIDLTGVSYDDSIDQVLLDFFLSPKASSLTKLCINCTTIPQSTLKSIMLSPTLSNLETVSFASKSTSRSHDWIDEFVSSPNCSKLKSLTLVRCNLTDSNLLALFQSPYLSNLRELDVCHNPALTDDSVKYLAQSGEVRLTALRLNNNPLLTPLIFYHLAQQSAQILSGFDRISLYGCPLITNENWGALSTKGWFDGFVLC